MILPLQIIIRSIIFKFAENEQNYIIKLMFYICSLFMNHKTLLHDLNASSLALLS